MSIETIVSIAAIIGSITAVVLSILKRPYEITGLDATAAKQYMETAKLQNEEYAKLHLDFEKYKKKTAEELQKMQEEVNLIKSELIRTKEDNAILKDWAERLVHQVQSLGATPVPMILKNKEATHGKTRKETPTETGPN